MNLFKFFVYQVVLSILGMVNNYSFKEFIYENFHINNKLIISLIKAPIDMILIYFTFKLYFLLKTKLRYKILIHIVALIIGTITLVLITNYIIK
ncbi:hypothetical protein AC625_09540 [Peribacillus loiseleuriae]|uniref:DUF5658 domain-containing protein n=1 Tax=Peribacillus loiseleuriae TaxID=1679170 RepID=A0A0K9GST4_9BACI|nr:hypothetical protein AC625_09540 [Peribacillus loiseleuriae]